MDIDEENIKKCFKLSHHLYENLNVIHNNITLMTVFWNKYQIFVYNDFNYEQDAKIFEPEFNIFKLLLADNYIICLDYSGNVHIVSLKFKHCVQKRFKSSFQPREKNVITMEYCANFTYTLKVASNTYYICKHRNSPDFQLEQQVAINFSNIFSPDKKPCLFHSYITSETEFEQIKGFFEMQEYLWNQHILFLISFDRLSLYAVLFSNNTTGDSIKPVKIYDCPTDMANVNVVKLEHLSILIGLTIGTIIQVPLNTSASGHIVHLNTAIHRILTINDTIFYTDNITLWKSEKIFTKNVEFKQLFIKHVKDFTFIGDKILCTTFSNLIYLFTIEVDICYVKPMADKYCPSENVLNDSDCLSKLMGVIDKSNEIISNINEKKHYITTLALSNRQDVMDTLIDYNIRVFENFNDIEEKNCLSLIYDIKEYYDSNSLYFLIKISAITLQSTLNEMLSNIMGDLKLHITLITRKNILKTVSLSFNGKMKIMNVVVPVKSIPYVHLNKVHVHAKLISNIPGIFETKQSVWALLHTKHFILNSEHFIKSQTNIQTLSFNNSSAESIDNLIIKAAMKQYGHLFIFNEISHRGARLWSVYLKLSYNYEELFKVESKLKENLNARKTEAIAEQITTKEFLKLDRELYFDVGEDKVILQIINDGFTKPLLKITCVNLEIAFDIKQFLSNLMYDFKNFKPEQEFVDQALYSTIENLEKSIRACMESQFSNTQEFVNLYDQYQKVVLSNLFI